MSQNTEYANAPKISYFNVAKKIIFTWSQEVKFLFQKQLMYYVRKSEFWNTRRVIFVTVSVNQTIKTEMKTSKIRRYKI